MICSLWSSSTTGLPLKNSESNLCCPKRPQKIRLNNSPLLLKPEAPRQNQKYVTFHVIQPPMSNSFELSETVLYTDIHTVLYLSIPQFACVNIHVRTIQGVSVCNGRKYLHSYPKLLLLFSKSDSESPLSVTLNLAHFNIMNTTCL